MVTFNSIEKDEFGDPAHSIGISQAEWQDVVGISESAGVEVNPEWKSKCFPRDQGTYPVVFSPETLLEIQGTLLTNEGVEFAWLAQYLQQMADAGGAELS